MPMQTRSSAWADAGCFSVDDLDEDPLSLPDATGLHDPAKRLGSAALAADHLAAVLLGDAQLQHDRLLVLFELGDLDLVGVIDQRSRQILEQLLQSRIPLTFRRFLTVLLGCAPRDSQSRTRSSSSSIVEGSV